jgi:hypothetical protein
MALYDKNKADWDAIALYRPNAAKMASMFDDYASMENALGFGSSVISKWVQKRGGISQEAERRARTWLSKQDAPSAKKTTGAVVFLVACPDGTSEKAMRILTMLGCDVTEV